MNRRVNGLDAASWILTAGQVCLAAAIAFSGPTHPLPMQFNAAGQVARWGDRAEMAGMVLLLATIAVISLLTRRWPKRTAGAEDDHGTALARFGVVLVLSMIALLSASLTWGWADQPGPRFGMGMIGAILAFIGALLGKTKPNALIGVRLPWTFQSRLAWDKANRLAGRLFFWGGLAGLVAAPFAPQPLGFHALHFGVLAAAVIVIFESWRVWRSDPDRRSSWR